MLTNTIASSKFLAFFDECGDHSLEKIDPDFPIFILSLVIVEKKLYLESILPEFNKFKLHYFDHEGVNLHSREIRLSTGPFSLLRNPLIRPNFMKGLSKLIKDSSFDLFISGIQKKFLLSHYGLKANDPYELALKFTVERLLHFLKKNNEKTLPIIAEARGKKEDLALKQAFDRILLEGTTYHPSEEFKSLNCTLSFQPKINNIVGIQLADLCAYPCARNVLSPAKENPAFEIVKQKIYMKNFGWKIFPKAEKQTGVFEVLSNTPANRDCSVHPDGTKNQELISTHEGN